MRTRLLATTAALLALTTGCGDERVATSDPGTAPSTSSRPPGSSTPDVTPDVTPSIADPAHDIGRAFRDFARGGDPPPMADQVELYLGNAFTGLVGPQHARDRAAWATCTEVGSYAASTCPISPLHVLRHHAAVEYADRPQGICMPTYGPVPPDLRKLDRAVIVPADGSTQSCAQNFAIQLFADDGGRLVAVSTLLGEP